MLKSYLNIGYDKNNTETTNRLARITNIVTAIGASIITIHFFNFLALGKLYFLIWFACIDITLVLTTILNYNKKYHLANYLLIISIYFGCVGAMIIFGNKFQNSMFLFAVFGMGIIYYQHVQIWLSKLIFLICILTIIAYEFLSYSNILPLVDQSSIVGFQLFWFRITDAIIAMIAVFASIYHTNKLNIKYQNALLSLNNGLESMISLRTSELVKERDKAQQANITKSMILANISHELRTPLNGIINYSQLGQNYTETTKYKDIIKLSKKLHEYFTKIEQNGIRQLNLVKKLLNISSLDYDKILTSKDVQEIKIKNICACINNELKLMANKKKITLNYNYSPDDLSLESNQDSLLRILLNLTSNAIKYGLESSQIIINFSKKKDLIEITVQNQGIGIREDEKESIFSEFYQSVSTYDGSGGVGLGLAISKKLANKINGTLILENPSKDKTIFKLTISKKFNIRT